MAAGTDSLVRGWTAIVNGQPADVVGANFLFRAVQVGPGTTPSLQLSAVWYPWLLGLSWSTLALVLAVTLRHQRATRTRGG